MKTTKRKIDLQIGQTIGRETIIESLGCTGGNAYYLCQCSCGTTYKRRSVRIHGKGCNGCSKRQWLTLDIPRGQWGRIERGAAKRSIPFDLTPQQVQDLFTKQGSKCALSGIPLVFHRDASIDRLDNLRGYSIGNVRIVHNYVNMLRGPRDDATLIRWCRLIADHNSPNPLTNLTTTPSFCGCSSPSL